MKCAIKSIYIQKNNDDRIKSRWHSDIVFMVISPDEINTVVVCDISNPSSYNLSHLLFLFWLITDLLSLVIYDYYI